MTNEQLAKERDIFALWTRNRKFIFHIFKKLLNGNPANWERMTAAGLTIDDLEQEAFFALLNAVEAFNPSGGYTFLNSLQYAAKTRFFELIGMRTAKGKNDPLTNADRLEREIAVGNSSAPLGDLLPDEEAESQPETVENDLNREQLLEVLSVIMDRLTPTEREVIEGIYFKGKTLARLAEEHGKSYNAIRQQRQSALRKLKRQGSRLRPFLWDDVPSVAYRGSLGAFKRYWASSTEQAVINRNCPKRKNEE